MSGSDVAGNRKELEQKLVSLGSTDKDDRAQLQVDDTELHISLWMNKKEQQKERRNALNQVMFGLTDGCTVQAVYEDQLQGSSRNG